MADRGRLRNIKNNSESVNMEKSSPSLKETFGQHKSDVCLPRKLTKYKALELQDYPPSHGHTFRTYRRSLSVVRPKQEESADDINIRIVLFLCNF